jgi:hypothetical protein
MNRPSGALPDNKIEVAKAFAQQFSHFEWEYLCSYQWFLTGVGRALETGNFAQLEGRAEQTLVDDNIRLPRETKKYSTHIVTWLG